MLRIFIIMIINVKFYFYFRDANATKLSLFTCKYVRNITTPNTFFSVLVLEQLFRDIVYLQLPPFVFQAWIYVPIVMGGVLGISLCPYSWWQVRGSYNYIEIVQYLPEHIKCSDPYIPVYSGYFLLGKPLNIIIFNLCLGMLKKWCKFLPRCRKITMIYI